MQAMNKAYYVNKQTPKQIASAFLKANGLTQVVKVVVLGGGSTGEHFVGALRRFDDEAQITLVESRLVGGECSYFACMPTKTMLRATELGASLDRAPGLHGERPEPDGVWSWRDWMTSDWDDAGQLHYLEEWKCRLVRGEGRVARPGVVEVDGQELPVRPARPRHRLAARDPADRRASTRSSTGRTATRRGRTRCRGASSSWAAARSAPSSRSSSPAWASQVTIVERGDHLLGRVHPDAGELMAELFREEGIDVRLGVGIERVEPGIKLHLSDGSTLEAERLLVATGRRPNVERLGLEELGVETTPRGVEVDERLRAAGARTCGRSAT